MIVGVFYTIQNDTYGIFSNAEEMLIILKWGKETRLKLEAHHDGHLGELCKQERKTKFSLIIWYVMCCMLGTWAVSPYFAVSWVVALGSNLLIRLELKFKSDS